MDSVLSFSSDSGGELHLIEEGFIPFSDGIMLQHWEQFYGLYKSSSPIIITGDDFLLDNPEAAYLLFHHTIFFLN